MSKPQRNGARRPWLWSAALLIPVLLLLGWHIFSASPAENEAGLVRIAGGTTPAAQPTAIAGTPAEIERRTLTPQRNSELVDEKQYLVLHENRDRAWADRSEAALLRVLRGMAHVDARSLAIRCTTSVCEVSGLAEEDPASGSMAPVWDALERDTDAASLRAQGLERQATTFGTGRVREAFMVYYRRIDPAPAS